MIFNTSDLTSMAAVQAARDILTSIGSIASSSNPGYIAPSIGRIEIKRFATQITIINQVLAGNVGAVNTQYDLLQTALQATINPQPGIIGNGNLNTFFASNRRVYVGNFRYLVTVNGVGGAAADSFNVSLCKSFPNVAGVNQRFSLVRRVNIAITPGDNTWPNDHNYLMPNEFKDISFVYVIVDTNITSALTSLTLAVWVDFDGFIINF